MSIGTRYQDLEPNADLVSPDKNADLRSYEGGAYCARTPARDIFLACFEKGAPRAQIRGAIPYATYRARGLTRGTELGAMPAPPRYAPAPSASSTFPTSRGITTGACV
jgi:hypothetical protein